MSVTYLAAYSVLGFYQALYYEPARVPINSFLERLYVAVRYDVGMQRPGRPFGFDTKVANRS